MDNNVFLIVLFASAMHAVWNGMVKNHPDKVIAISGIVYGRIPLSIIAIIFLPLPSINSIPYIIGGVIIHQLYQLSLLNSYKIGDLTKVYPISRGSGPLVATIISVLILGIVLDKVIIFSICLICFGIIFLSLLDKSIQNQKTVRYSLLTGLCIGLYSIIDGYGARLSPSAISFISWSFIINAILYPLVIKLIKEKDIFTRIKEKGKNIFFVGGTLDYLTYVIVVWSFTKAPIPMVGALRETSILFTMLIGYFFLKEKITAIKIFSILMILSGVIALKLL